MGVILCNVLEMERKCCERDRKILVGIVITVAEIQKWHFQFKSQRRCHRAISICVDHISCA